MLENKTNLTDAEDETIDLIGRAILAYDKDAFNSGPQATFQSHCLGLISFVLENSQRIQDLKFLSGKLGIRPNNLEVISEVVLHNIAKQVEATLSVQEARASLGLSPIVS